MDLSKIVNDSYRIAKERYAELDIDTDAAIEALSQVSLSFPCWQLDDVNGLERMGEHNGGGTVVTGSHPGKARNGDELRSDAEEVFSLVPGRHRLNLHSIYRECRNPVPRDEIAPEHFSRWVSWAKALGIGLDFNPTYFDHPNASDGFTLSHADEGIRQFWIRHGIAARQVSSSIGVELGKTCIMNTWVPDGFKDSPVDRASYRMRLRDSLDAVFTEELDRDAMRDAVESKLFGIGSESCTIGSHEFYMGYALQHGKMVCFDMGHFHPTEQIGDKLSSMLLFSEELLLHLSRPVRWDSDHVVVLDPELELVAEEIVRNGYLGRVHLALDYFDGTLNRVAALAIGGRATLRAFCRAFLEPHKDLAESERRGDFTTRLLFQEELKAMPWQAVWDYWCLSSGVPVGSREFLERTKKYESSTLAARG
jgi:L-rhamnose isomerase